MNNLLAIAGLLVLALLVVIASPLIFIWCVNTLFGCGIDYSLLHWFAAFLLLGLSNSGSYRSNKS